MCIKLTESFPSFAPNTHKLYILLLHQYCAYPAENIILIHRRLYFELN